MLAASHFVSSTDIEIPTLHNTALKANTAQSASFMDLSRSKRILESSFIGDWVDDVMRIQVPVRYGLQWRKEGMLSIGKTRHDSIHEIGKLASRNSFREIFCLRFGNSGIFLGPIVF